MEALTIRNHLKYARNMIMKHMPAHLHRYRGDLAASIPKYVLCLKASTVDWTDVEFFLDKAIWMYINMLHFLCDTEKCTQAFDVAFGKQEAYIKSREELRDKQPTHLSIKIHYSPSDMEYTIWFYFLSQSV